MDARLRSLAYGYLGSLADSEDIVQEALLRLHAADPASIHNTEAWLTTVVTRLCLDRLRSAQHRRETYPGEWLPEPVFNAPSPEQDAITRSRLSIGLLWLMEKLEPEQRIVFVLREVFEHPYQTIAEIAGKSEAACRQLMVRARAALGKSAALPPTRTTDTHAVVERFITALQRGDEKELLTLLAPDAILVGDGGGKVQSVMNPIYGADRIIRFFFGLAHKYPGAFAAQPAEVNSAPGILTFREGALYSAAGITIENGRITGIYSVANPDKLRGHPESPETKLL
jgi:RNA polymerase sigma-70 factor (ECF subfamily)